VEERFRQKDGTWLWVEVTNAPFMWQGRLAVQVVVRDISERKWLQGKLEELTAQLQAIFRHVPYGLAAEHAGRVAWANQRFAQLFGYGGPGDMYGLPIERIVAPEDRERVAGYTALRDKGLDAPATYTFKALRRDGTVVELENSVTTYDIGGRSYILGSVRPVEGDKPGRR
ncbi:PAS domain S-box protein, partial [candidate division WOR-3 bacterium]|nr:PAS domain S-box protein [candidate division WOR-3 bacterium]